MLCESLFIRELLYNNPLSHCYPSQPPSRFPNHLWMMKKTFHVILTGFQKKTHVCFEHTSTQGTICGATLNESWFQSSIHIPSYFSSLWSFRMHTAWGTCHLYKERNKKWYKPISLDSIDTDGDGIWTILSAWGSFLKPLALITMKPELFISPQFSDVV